MELSHYLLDNITKPSFVFASAAKRSDIARQLSSQSADDNNVQPWNDDSLNPKNRIDSLDTSNSKWRIDGVTLCGTQFYAVPVNLLGNLVPLRIDLFIPDQKYHPVELRRALQSDYAVHLRDPTSLAGLGISRHLCRALDHYSETTPVFWTDYQNLPFGSRLVFEEITADIKHMRLSITPAHALERQSLSVASLKKLWQGDVPESNWPESIDISCLRLKREIQDSISLVRIVDGNHETEGHYIFKSNNAEFKYLYNELRFLLKNPQNPNIMRPPLYVVTKKSNFGGKHGVYGFILPYYQKGSIRNVLPARTLAGTLSVKQQLKWSVQLTSALIHIREKAGAFYSDLRPDNVLLSPSSQGDEDIILCDFEQRGNWHEWCAPEVLYRVYAQNLRMNSTSAAENHRWKELVEKYSPGDSHAGNTLPHARNPIWSSLSPDVQEQAQVYTLGLMIYCIFEGLSNVRISLANTWPHDPDIEFPMFRRSPDGIQACIKRCTAGAPEWDDENSQALGDGSSGKRPKRVAKITGKLYPACQMEAGEDFKGVAYAVLETARLWWESELDKAKNFLDKESSNNPNLRRPSLRDVLSMLENI